MDERTPVDVTVCLQPTSTCQPWRNCNSNTDEGQTTIIQHYFGPATDWRPIPGVPCLCPTVALKGSTNPMCLDLPKGEAELLSRTRKMVINVKS